MFNITTQKIFHHFDFARFIRVVVGVVIFSFFLLLQPADVGAASEKCGTVNLRADNYLEITFLKKKKGVGKIYSLLIASINKKQSIIQFDFRSSQYFNCIKSGMQRYENYFSNVKWAREPRRSKSTNSLLLYLKNIKVYDVEKIQHIVNGRNNGWKFVFKTIPPKPRVFNVINEIKQKR